MNLSRLFKTTAFRLSIALAFVFSLAAVGSLEYIYWSSNSYIYEQLDSRLRLESDVLARLYRSRALPELLETIRHRNRRDRGGSYVYLLSSAQQRNIAGPAARWDWDRLPPSQIQTVPLNQILEITPEAGGNVHMRVLVTHLEGGYELLVAHEITDERALVDHLFASIVVAILVTVGLALAGGLWMGMSVLRHIDGVNTATDNIMAGDLTQRIPLGHRHDEFDELALRLNAMLDRIEQLMNSMRDVTDNIAHDLRSPLNRLRNQLELVLIGDATKDTYRDAIEAAIIEADETIKTFNALLSIAKVESGLQSGDLEDVSLDVLVADIGELYEPAAEDKHLVFSCRCESEVTIRGHRRLLSQAVSNLLDNAIKYTPEGGRVELSASRRGGCPVITIADSGPGIPEADRTRVLERLVRLDTERNTAGSGLGLSLVKVVAARHKADLVLADNNPGLKVEMIFCKEVG